MCFRLKIFYIKILFLQNLIVCRMTEYSSTELEGYHRLCQRLDGIYCVHCEHSSVEELCPGQCRTCSQATRLPSYERLKRECVQLTGSFCVACNNPEVSGICTGECATCVAEGRISAPVAGPRNPGNDVLGLSQYGGVQTITTTPNVQLPNGQLIRKSTDNEVQGMGFISASNIIGTPMNGGENAPQTDSNRGQKFVAVPPGSNLAPYQGGTATGQLFPIGSDYFQSLQETSHAKSGQESPLRDQATINYSNNGNNEFAENTDLKMSEGERLPEASDNFETASDSEITPNDLGLFREFYNLLSEADI